MPSIVKGLMTLCNYLPILKKKCSLTVLSRLRGSESCVSKWKKFTLKLVSRNFPPIHYVIVEKTIYLYF